MRGTFEIKGNGLDALANVLSEMPKKLPKEIATIANLVAKQHTKAIAKQVSARIKITNKDAQKAVTQIKRASEQSLSAKVEIKREFRPSLKRFGLKQLKRGISYKISKKGGTVKIVAPPRKRVKGSAKGSRTRHFGPVKPTPFVSQKLGGHAYVREGREQLPIAKLEGPSIWGVYVKNDLLAWSMEELPDEFLKQVERRIRAITVGIIRNKGRRAGLSTEQINQQIKTQLG